jgi:hypothetical protein
MTERIGKANRLALLLTIGLCLTTWSCGIIGPNNEEEWVDTMLSVYQRQRSGIRVWESGI